MRSIRYLWIVKCVCKSSHLFEWYELFLSKWSPNIIDGYVLRCTHLFIIWCRSLLLWNNVWVRNTILDLFLYIDLLPLMFIFFSKSWLICVFFIVIVSWSLCTVLSLSWCNWVWSMFHLNVLQIRVWNMSTTASVISSWCFWNDVWALVNLLDEVGGCCTEIIACLLGG